MRGCMLCISVLSGSWLLSQGAYARLYALHIRFVWQLVAYPPRYWSTASRLGAKLTKQISDALSGYGLYLGMDIENIFTND